MRNTKIVNKVIILLLSIILGVTALLGIMTLTYAEDKSYDQAGDVLDVCKEYTSRIPFDGVSNIVESIFLYKKYLGLQFDLENEFVQEDEDEYYDDLLFQIIPEQLFIDQVENS